MTDFTAGPQTRALWQDAAATVERITALPFLRQLVAGTLAPRVFTYYLLQDDLYLAGYARALALLAAKAPRPEEARFWAQSVAGAIAVEEEVHQALLADPRLVTARAQLGGAPQPSPTTLGYVSCLEANAALRPYAVGVAAILPCFWVYAQVGKHLIRQAGTLPEGHPYRAWIALYDSPEFDAATRTAVGILERCLAAADAEERAGMRRVFLQACTYELHFWHAASILQDWSLPAAAV